MQKEKGSILVLTVISVLILSIMVIGLLTVGTTEVQTTQNFQLNKAAYYAAAEGVEEIRTQIMANPADTEYIKSLTSSVSQNQETESFETGLSDRQFENLGISRSYVTGNLKDFQANTPQPPMEFSFGNRNALGASRDVQFRGMNLGDTRLPRSTIWKVQVTAEAGMGSRKGYSQIDAGIYSIIITGD
ncbi:MAG TPA: hypothetical protein VK186_23785 [Candidatus Deferrimicrobium sp.]|nr:hypothetical protein [Candidatus Deferrimicrobium sp.]